MQKTYGPLVLWKRSRTIPLTFDCDVCARQHSIELNSNDLSLAQLTQREPVLKAFVCPDGARMHRVLAWSLDTRVSVVTQVKGDALEKYLLGLKSEWGTHDFDAKLKRFTELNISYIGMPAEYSSFFSQVIHAHVCGLYYPAMTSCGSLGERVLNQLILKLRHYYKDTPEYKKIYSKTSFDDWEKPIVALQAWNVISLSVAADFRELKKYRNDAVHFRPDYPFEVNSAQAIKLLFKIIKAQFSYTDRKDLFWIFDVPGEIWVRSAVVDDPFVKEFVLPSCAFLTAYCEPTLSPPVQGKGVPCNPCTDEEFILARKNHRSPSPKND